MTYNIKFTFHADHEDPVLISIRNAARAEKWVGTPGFKQWAKENYNATLRTGKYGDWTSISFTNEQDLIKFKAQHGGVEK